MDYLAMTLVELHKCLVNKEITPVELVKLALDELHASPDNAVETFNDEEALKEIQGHWEANKDLINAATKELEKHNGKWSKVSKTTKKEMRKLAKAIKPQLM